MPDSPDRLTQQVFLSVLFQRKKRRVRNSVTHTVYRPRETGPQPPENVFCNSVLYATRKHVIQAHNPLKMFSAVLLCGQKRTHVILAHNPPKMFSAVLPCTRKLFCPVQGSFSALYNDAFLACTMTLFWPVQGSMNTALSPRSHACRKAPLRQRGRPAADNQIHQYHQARHLRTIPERRERRRVGHLLQI